MDKTCKYCFFLIVPTSSYAEELQAQAQGYCGYVCKKLHEATQVTS